jgi:predicted TIM-barrel fold metal-dependent hydrolase
LIFDIHAHLGHCSQFNVPDISVERLVKIMQRFHIDKMLCSHMALLAGDTKLGFRESVDAYSLSQGCIMSYSVFDPRIPNGLDFVKQCANTPGFVGIKIHPSFHQCYGDDDSYRPVWKFACENALPILTHSWDYSDSNSTQKYSFPSRFERWVKDFPEVPLILGHAGGRYGGHLEAVRMANEHKNVFLDISGDSYSLGLIEFLVAKTGAEKILYGSDATWIDPRTQIGRVLDAQISTADKDKIFRRNAMKIFKVLQ